QMRNAIIGAPRPGTSVASIRRVQMLESLFDAPTRYLEIGIWKGHTFSAVQFDHKDGVDPSPQYFARRRCGESIHRMTSDAFFAQGPQSKPYDVIFLDGLHTFEQTARDVWNSMAAAGPRTVWLIDDVVPANEAQAAGSIEQAFQVSSAAGAPSYAWTGDVYRLAYAFESMSAVLDYRTITGSGREQMLVWLTTDDLGLVATLGRQTCTHTPEVSYSEAFPHGPKQLQQVFRAATELDALRAVQAAR
ncbi:MAG: class I SAM-dependent methyltransferase, partial [Actinomycetota bacterium]|nr:class I SAM-dependent methyltransferase [Actinomycetota bacterium]